MPDLNYWLVFFTAAVALNVSPGPDPIIIESLFVLAAARSASIFRRNPKASAFLDRALGTVFVSLGIRLALTEQRT